MIASLLPLLVMTAPPVEPACVPLPGIEQVLAEARLNYLLIGEYHGTVEMPQVAADALCAAAETGRPVILGVEFSPENQSFLDAYVRSDGSAAAREALLRAPAWKEEGGRTTGAILAMIEEARKQAKRGRNVSVVAFDLVPQPILSKEREEGLARGLTEARAKVPGALVIALTGAGHAGKTAWSSQNPPFASAGQILPQGESWAFTFARPGGQFWGCAAPNGGPSDGCKAYDMPAREPVQPRGIRLDSTIREGFDGIYSAGRAYQASKPALPKP